MRVSKKTIEADEELVQTAIDVKDDAEALKSKDDSEMPHFAAVHAAMRRRGGREKEDVDAEKSEEEALLETADDSEMPHFAAVHAAMRRRGGREKEDVDAEKSEEG